MLHVSQGSRQSWFSFRGRRRTQGQIRVSVRDRASVPWLRWAAQRWQALAAVAVASPLAVVAVVATLYWPARPFPGFFVMGNAVIPTVGLYSWTGLAEGVPFHARVRAADGYPIRKAADLYEYVRSLPVGKPVRYSLTKGGQDFERTVATMRFGARDYWLTVGLLVVFGIMALASGVIVSLLQPRTSAAQAFLICGFFTGLFGLTGTTLYHPDLWWLSPFHFVTQAAFPASFIHLGLVFPVERRFVSRHRAWLLLPYVIAGLLSVWVFVDFYASQPSMTPLYGTYLYSAAGIVAIIGLVGFAYWENRTPAVRAQLRLVLPGLVVGTVVGLFGFVNTAQFGGDFPINLIAIAPVLFYLSVFYAIAKHDLFDIDALVRQAVIYGTLTLAITGAYAGSLVVMDLVLSSQVAQRSPVFNIVFIVLVAFLFEPLRERVQRVIDRTFYRNRPDYRRTVGEVSTALTSLLDLDEILSQVGHAVTDGLQLGSLAVILWIEDEPIVLRFDPGSGRMARDAMTCHAIRGYLTRGVAGPCVLRDGVEPDAGETAAARGEMQRLGATIVIPLTVGACAIGAFALGPKLSGHVFSGGDIELLDTLAAQSAVAIQNAHSYRALRALNQELEAKVRARTGELEASNAQLVEAYHALQRAQGQLVQTEKMAALGQLVAGVAHEINNPVSFIVSNIDPLRKRLATLRDLADREGIAKLRTAVGRVTEVLDVIARGAERTAGIVKDLRSFSRLGEQQASPADLHEGIEVSLRLLQPRFANRITVHRDYGDLPAVEVDPGQINQVFMNILANAGEAISGTGNVWIHTTVCEGAHVTVTIRDDGAGISPEHLRKIFDPFFTTKPMGKGTGLGLAISHGIVADHGGSIRVVSERNRGAEFIIVLPIKQTGKQQAAG